MRGYSYIQFVVIIIYFRTTCGERKLGWQIVSKYRVNSCSPFEVGSVKTYVEKVLTTEANLGLVKLVVMTNVLLNYHQHEIEIKRLIYVR